MNTRTSLFVCIFTGMLYASFYGYMLMNFADTFAWFSLVSIQMFLIGVSWLSFVLYQNAQDAIDGTTRSQEAFGWVHFDINNISMAIMAVGILFVIFALLYYCLVFRNFKHIKIAINIFDASADFAVNHFRLVISIFIYLLILLGSFFLWFYIFLYVMSLNEIGHKQIGGTNFKTFEYSNGNLVVLTFSVFAYVWFLLTINVLIKFWIICSVATYYFNSDD